MSNNFFLKCVEPNKRVSQMHKFRRVSSLESNSRSFHSGTILTQLTMLQRRSCWFIFQKLRTLARCAHIYWRCWLGKQQFVWQLRNLVRKEDNEGHIWKLNLQQLGQIEENTFFCLKL